MATRKQADNEADAKVDETKADESKAAAQADEKGDDGVTLTVVDPESEIPQFNQTGANPQPGKGPEGQDVPTKDEKAFVLAAVTQPEVTSVNPEPYTVEEINHRFSHVPPEGYVKHKITIQGVTDVAE